MMFSRRKLINPKLNFSSWHPTHKNIRNYEKLSYRFTWSINEYFQGPIIDLFFSRIGKTLAGSVRDLLPRTGRKFASSTRYIGHRIFAAYRRSARDITGSLTRICSSRVLIALPPSFFFSPFPPSHQPDVTCKLPLPAVPLLAYHSRGRVNYEELPAI